MSMIHAMSVKKANKGKKEKEESCSDQVDENMKNTDQMLRIKNSLIFKFVFFLPHAWLQCWICCQLNQNHMTSLPKVQTCVIKFSARLNIIHNMEKKSVKKFENFFLLV